MKKPILRLSLASTAIAAALCGPVAAEDIDLFVGTNATAANPNVVIMIDNSANWDANNQHWPTGKQGESELRALGRAATEVKDGSINLGLMLFTPGVGTTPNGAYVRFHVSTLDTTVKKALQEQIGVNALGQDFCVPGNNSLTFSPNCILQNFSSPGEKVGTSKLDYSAGLFEVFKYFGGFADPAHAINDSPGGPSGYTGETPTDASHFGPYRYARNGGAAEPYSDPRAYNGASKTGYNTPFNPDGTGSCARNYLIFIGNGFPNQDSPATLLTGVGGSATQLKIPTFNVTTNLVSSTLGTQASCMSKAQCVAAATTAFPNYDIWDCTGGTGTPNTPLGTDATCHTNAQCVAYAQTVQGGHTTYICTGGTAGPGTSGTDLKCETPASCSTTTGPAQLPGYTGYSCSGGTTSATATTTLGTDAVTESVAACKLRAAAAYPGYSSYDCTGGTIVTTTPSTIPSPTCESAASCLTNAPTRFPGHDTYVSCTGGSGCTGGNKKDQTLSVTDIKKSGMTMKGIGCAGGGKLTGQTISANSSCLVNQVMTATDSCLVNQTIIGKRNVNTVVPTENFVTPAANATNHADEWAKYLSSTDTNSVSGQQTVTTYTIDVFKDAQDANETALLYSMAKYGGGKYFQAKDENSILDALRDILSEIQSVNTVFASASLPINATNRSQNENQVFIGMFRPDGKGRPRWYGNLKHYKVALFSGDARLADSLDKEAISATTGFVTACAQSFYTTDSDILPTAGPPATPLIHYWEFSPLSAGRCISKPANSFNDLPDGGVVEKGGAAEVLRRGNNPGAPDTTVNRNLYTCEDAPCTGITTFDATSVTPARTGASAALNPAIVDYTRGKDLLDENNNTVTNETRPTIHGDIAHSRPLPVNFGPGRGVEVYYGSNDGAFHAMRGSDGKELWSFIAPEHHSKLKRLYDNAPSVAYPGTTGTTPKDYFFDGSAGLYQTDGATPTVWVFPTMRRGGRMIYAFDISTSAVPPTFKWAKGCPDIVSDTGCTAGMKDIGLTWSVPNAARIRGYASGADPVLIVGGGYDLCEDSDLATTTCTATSKGHMVYVLDAGSGTVLASFPTEGSVPSDITLIDRDYDGMVDHGYVLDTRGNLYRIDFIDPVARTPRTSGAWSMTKIAFTKDASRKFLFGPAALSTSPITGPITYLSFGSGDRERPLITNYPYVSSVQNRFYMYTDKFQSSGLPVDLDGSNMTNNSAETTCGDEFDDTKSGWYMDLKAGQGEQTVTSSVIFGGTVFFSTNRPVSVDKNSCATNLGEARGYAVNLLNASGVIRSGKLCGGDRSGVFTGGGLPPSPVVGTVPVRQSDGTDKPISVLIGGINLDTGTGSPIGAQEPPVPIKQIRSRVYWYKHGDK